MENTSDINPKIVSLTEELQIEPISLQLAEGEFFVFGRDSACDLTIKDIAVSRRHCRIFRDGDDFYIEDLNSHNGTLVNDLSVKTRRLEHADKIRIGNYNFVILTEESNALLTKGKFDDGTLITNSVIRIVPSAEVSNLPTDLNVLIKLGKAINEIKETEALKYKILEIILEFIPAQRGAILVVDEDLSEPQVVCVLAKGFSDAAPMQISRTVSQQVLDEQIALLSNDLSDKNLEKSLSLMMSRVSSLLCVPLKIGDKKGLIYLDTSDVDTLFTENHLEQITALSFLIPAALENVASIEGLRQENALLKNSLHIETNMIGESKPLQDAFRLISKVATTETTVLITGESGTGKELAAQAIHRNSPRSEKPFVAINCATLNENLLESELFGHERGAFTGAHGTKRGKLEIADGGTVFLDEIGELAPALQVKLLRVLQEREFERVGGTKTMKANVRVIAATNRNLEDEVKNGRFRSDLFFRLNVVQIKMPSLRERKSDIPLLAEHFIHKYSALCHRKVVGLSPEARKILLAGSWQGNIRELQNVIERAVVLGSSDKIMPEDLPLEMVETDSREMALSGDFYEQIKQAKQKILLSAINNSNGNFTEAARLLGVHPNNLHRLVRELGIKEELNR